ncbi:hypothetical protein PR202_ga02703 [Eleusine coracana subsp. coracana]|uniref:Protease Do-like PDZ domain-containing protein n=1 Tax=Eleusine coracana subsp. coracana TaxID=191504 RepID=A0AAV5BM60_ELECO|nr:hypothetical protein PR202_ga02703 [Eleusine coracana subsp. coracana]
MEDPSSATKRSKRKHGRKPKASPASPNRSSPSPPPASDPVPAVGGRRGRKSRRHEAPADADASRPVSPPRRGELKPVVNGGDAMAVVEAGPASWEEVVRVVPCMDAVVKVFCVHTEPNFLLPWQRKRQYSSSSSGFIIGGRRVLTNAHSVEHYTQVKLKKRGSDTKYVATVLAIGTECDIALLTVNDDEFLEGVSPVEFGTLPALQDAVTVVGYPIGGDTISVTSGVVSRIEILSYVHGSTELLGWQAVPLITFLIHSSVVHGFPILEIEWQKMENPDLRKAMGMKPDQKGVRVRRLEPTAPESGCLQPSDIILSFDSVDIANDGTVPFRHGERIGFSYLVSQKYTGEKALVKVLWNLKMLVADINIGYEDIVNTQVLAFNGQPVKNLKNLATMVENCKDEFLKFDLEYDQIVVLETKTAKAATQDILTTHCIPSAMSDDLKT